MQRSFEQAVKLEMRASSKMGMSPPALSSEAAAICAVLDKRLEQIEQRLPPRPCNESYRPQSQ